VKGGGLLQRRSPGINLILEAHITSKQLISGTHIRFHDAIGLPFQLLKEAC
jgi:hypothetical protein